jgi:hypothetical protein
MADAAAAAPAAPAGGVALIQPANPMTVFHTVGMGESTFAGGVDPCRRPCCLLQSTALWQQTPLNDIVVTGGAQPIPTVLGAFYTEFEASDQSQASFCCIITKQRKYTRNLIFMEASYGVATGIADKISGARVIAVRIAYNHFEDFTAEQLTAARTAQGGYPTLNSKIFPRAEFAAQNIRLAGPRYLHTLSADAFKLELKTVFMLFAGSQSAADNFVSLQLHNGVQPFLHHGTGYAGPLTGDENAHRKVRALFQRVVAAESFTELDSEDEVDDYVHIHPTTDAYKWCDNGMVNYANKTAVQGLAAKLYGQLSSSYEPRFAQTLPGKKRKKGGHRRISGTEVTAVLLGLADCIDKSKLQITAANMQAVHTIVCRDKDHTQGRQTLAAEIVEAVKALCD